MSDKWAIGDSAYLKVPVRGYRYVEVVGYDGVKIVDAPIVSLVEGQEVPGDLLLNFYRILGWDGEANLDPTKVRTANAVYNGIRNQIMQLCKKQNINEEQVGFFMVNSGPGVDDDIPTGKVHLYKGWVCQDGGVFVCHRIEKTLCLWYTWVAGQSTVIESRRTW